MHYNASLVVFSGCVLTLQRANGNLVPKSVVLPMLLQKVSINLTNMRKARSNRHTKVSTESKQPTFDHRPSLVMMKNMHYPREKRGMLFTKMSQLVINPNFSPMTMKSMYHIQSELRRTRPKNGLMTIYNLNLPTSANHKKNQDIASSSNVTKAQCLLDLPIASYPAMYEYLDKNNFEVGMQLLGATNKANIRKQYLQLSVKLHPDKDQTNVHATERFALLLRTYAMLQKMP